MYPMMNLNNPGMMMKDGMLSDTGIMRKEWDVSTKSWKYARLFSIIQQAPSAGYPHTTTIHIKP